MPWLVRVGSHGDGDAGSTADGDAAAVDKRPTSDEHDSFTTRGRESRSAEPGSVVGLGSGAGSLVLPLDFTVACTMGKAIAGKAGSRWNPASSVPEARAVPEQMAGRVGASASIDTSLHRDGTGRTKSFRWMFRYVPISR